MAKTKSKQRKRATFDDPWIREWSAIDPAKEHALGTLTLAWNACETQLLVLFIIIARLEPRQGWIISHDLGNIALTERILETAKYRNEKGELASDILEAVRHALRVFDVCRQNRNSFTHFKTKTISGGARQLIRMKGPSMYNYPLPDDLPTFRRVAVETRKLSRHLVSLWEQIDRINKGEAAFLPERLVIPELVWKP